MKAKILMFLLKFILRKLLPGCNFIVWAINSKGETFSVKVNKKQLI